MAILNGRRCAITPEMEAEIVAMYDAGLGTQKEIGKCYGVGSTTISKVVREHHSRQFAGIVRDESIRRTRANAEEDAFYE